ncbi:MAG: flavoprotein [Candidatus Omnitrophota bacterium]
MKNKKIILGVSAGIAAYKSAEIIRALQKQGISPTVIMTPRAKRFISPLTLETVSGNRVYDKMFGRDSYRPEHISLADGADLILIAPATADIIARISGGICDDLLTTTVCAASCPALIAPAMNENMYRNKITRDNIQRLRRYGYKFIPPRRGTLACGKTGQGCLAKTETIVQEVGKALRGL